MYQRKAEMCLPEGGRYSTSGNLGSLPAYGLPNSRKINTKLRAHACLVLAVQGEDLARFCAFIFLGSRYSGAKADSFRAFRLMI